MTALAARSSTSLPSRVFHVLRWRLVQLLPVLFGVTLVTFFLVRLLPGGPAQTLVGVRASAQTIAAVNRQLGLNESLPGQYWHYVTNLFHGNLGQSLITGESVSSIVSSHIAVTLGLLLYAVVLVLCIGVPLAVLAATSKRAWIDLVIRALAVTTLGMPSFWIGGLLVAYLGLSLGWFPSGGAGQGLLSNLWHLFLPAMTLAFTFLAVVVRSLRDAIAGILRADYVDLARLKGLGRVQLVKRHILRVSLRPVITLVGMNMSFLLGTSVIVENVFAIPGIGQQLVSAIVQRDFLVVQGITLIFGVIVIAINLSAELIQTCLDPRVG